MEVIIRDKNTGGTRPIPKQMFERQKGCHPEWELVSEDIREPMKVKPLDEVQAFIKDATKTQCCKPDTDFIKICKEVETHPSMIEPATAFLIDLLNEKPPEVTKPEAVEKNLDDLTRKQLIEMATGKATPTELNKMNKSQLIKMLNDSKK